MKAIVTFALFSIILTTYNLALASSPVPKKLQIAPEGGWIQLSEPRLGQKSPLNLGQQTFIAGAKAVSDINAFNLFRTLMHSPKLFKKWLGFAKQLMPGGSIDRADTELMILRVAWNTKSRYEWGQHVHISTFSKKGKKPILTFNEVKRVTYGPHHPKWNQKQRALLLATDEIHKNKFITQSTWEKLSRAYKGDKAKILEAVMVMNHYEMLAGVLISTGIQLDKELETYLANAPIH